MTAITGLFSLKATFHGVLVNVDDVGVLLTGEADVGKSECALELIVRGRHRLVADDVVEVERLGNVVSGRSPDGFLGIIAVRGLGLIDLRCAFGDSSTDTEHSIELCIQFEACRPPEECSLIGGEMSEAEILGVKIPRFIFYSCRSRNCLCSLKQRLNHLRTGRIAVDPVYPPA